MAESILQLMKAFLSIHTSNSTVLQEVCSLANIVPTKNKASFPMFLSFVHTVIEMHGGKAEIISSADDNKNSTAIRFRGIIKQLMILSFEGVIPASAICGQTTTSLPHDSEEVPALMSPMFKTLSICAAKCPIFLLSISRNDHAAGELVLSSVHASPSAISVAEVEVSSSAIHFLNVLVSFEF